MWTLYKEATRIVALVESKQGSAKNLILSSTFERKRQLMALVYETLKFSDVLQHILTASNLQLLERNLKNTHLTKVLLYDLLFGQGIQGGGKQVNSVRKHSALLHTELDHLKAKLNARTNTDLLSSTQTLLLPRYVRVNTLKTSVADVAEHFCKDGYRHTSVSGCDFEQFQQKVQSLKPDEFVCDIHIPELLVFAAGTDLHEHELCTSGSILLQDKASCLPAVVLNPPRGSHVIDCCAAPGNKLTFLAALMNNEGRIFAFDWDAPRLSTMRTLLEKTGADCVSATCTDFLQVSPDDPKYKDVEYILVDPSCSGSGMVNRIGWQEESSDSEALDQRLTSLSNFQAMLLRHALSFPSVRRVVYSTCSVYERENESVILDVLQSTSAAFQLVDVLPMFSSRGKSSALPHAERCVRMFPETSLTVGFFIACLERADQVPSDFPSSSKLEFDRHLHTTLVDCDLTSDKMQTESSAADVRRKSHKHKKSKNEKAVKIENSKPDASSVVKERSNSELDGQLQKTVSNKKSFVSKPSTGILELEHDTTGESGRSHKRKKSKKETASRVAKLEQSETEKLDHVQNSPDTLPTGDATQTVQFTAGDRKRSHKHNKSKKEKATDVKQTEIDAAVVAEMSQSKLAKRSQNNLSQSASELTSGLVQTEHDTVRERRKVHKHKKSKKEKAEVEHSEIDSTVAVDGSKLKNSKKHRKHCA